MTLLVPLLAVTLVMLVRKPLHAPRSASGAPSDGTTGMTEEARAMQIDWELPPVYQPTRGDPMRLAAPTFVVEDSPIAVPRAEVRKHMALRGVLYSTKRPAAIVGTELVHEGDEVAGVIVFKIERDGVVFERNGERWKQAVSAPADPPATDTNENRNEPTGPQGNDDEKP